jgi:hypothetical protein
MTILRHRLERIIGPRATRRLLAELGGELVRLPEAHPYGRSARRARDLAIIAILQTPLVRNPDRTPSYQQVADALGLTRRQIIRIANTPT